MEKNKRLARDCGDCGQATRRSSVWNTLNPLAQRWYPYSKSTVHATPNGNARSMHGQQLQPAVDTC